MGDNERIHGDEDYIAEQERAAAEDAVEVEGGPALSEEAEEAERALAEVGAGELEEGELEAFEEAEQERPEESEDV
jgi:hypothetical protein